jgi:hypothetical protein
MERGESKRRIAAGDDENITYTIHPTYDILPSTAIARPELESLQTCQGQLSQPWIFVN